MHDIRNLLVVICALMLAACSGHAPPRANADSVRLNGGAAYRLDAGDRLRITVFEEADLSGDFTVSDEGSVSLALIGQVPARGRTADEFEADITARLNGRILLDPQVTVEVLEYRPFAIYGEVIRAGSYAYRPGLTALGAVAAAQGFTYRADQRRVFIRGAGEAEERTYSLDSNVVILPGDTVRVGERYF
jgi:polysaccharide export outer membrane protein